MVMPSAICVAVYVCGEMDAWSLSSSIISKMSCTCSVGVGGMCFLFLGVGGFGVVGGVSCDLVVVVFVVSAFLVSVVGVLFGVLEFSVDCFDICC